ncbi:hypothetical protein WICPIJ_003632 [Wickerhamomyces pijperi]|uniref:Rab-GAP TBC domain-containing protein n=1 Tax=Wickerhamomyces pijperi TaxID=599730 RepID=A0A9P8Q9L4_WICPI|nr:hypothetical protein WICPIJ_003632 [Wickerhamomyces pijperi]
MNNSSSDNAPRDHQKAVRSPLGRSNSIGIFRSSKRNSIISKSQSPLHHKPPTGNEEDTTSHLGIALNAPIHSNLSTDSVNQIPRNGSVISAGSKSHNGSPPGIFDSASLDSEVIPGNIHISSNKSIDHLIKRYGAVSLIRQLSTDLAQRDAEITILRRKNSIRENILIRLLNETGLSTNEVESMLRDRLNSTQSSDDQASLLETLMEDAMSEHLESYSYEHQHDIATRSLMNLSVASPVDSLNYDNNNEDLFKTVTSKELKRRPHSSSLPPDPRSVSASTTNHPSTNSEQLNHSITDNSSSQSLLNLVSNRFLNQIVPQNLQDALSGSTGYHNSRPYNNNLPIPVEMENLATTASTDIQSFGESSANEGKGYINAFGFIYDKNKDSAKKPTVSTRTGPSRPTSVSLDSMGFTSKLLSIANDHDNNQKQGLKQWEDFLKKLALMSSNPYTESTELLAVNGESIKAHKHLFKEFEKIVITQGIPMKYRPKIWYELSNVKYLSTPGEYYQLINSTLPNKESEKQIELDIYRTMPFNIYFKDNNSPGLMKLQNILIAFARKYPEIGYCQGMNFIVANLLIVYANNEEETFWVFVGLVIEKLPCEFFQLSNIRRDLEKLPMIFAKNLPKLWKHLQRLEVELELICFNWFISLFSESLPTEIVLKIWDLVMVNGYVELFKVTVALFKVFEAQLLGFGSCMEVYDFMKNLNKVNVNLKGFELIKLSSKVGIDDELDFNK